MPRTPVQPTDLVPLVVAALNNTTVNGGTLKAVANGHEILLYPHNDAPGTYATPLRLRVL